MEKMETIWRLLVTSLAVWRLSQLFFGESEGARKPADDSTGGRFWVHRAMDFLCWISVWLSSQTALWVACGFAGMILSWVTVPGVSRVFARAGDGTEASGTNPDAADLRSTERACVSCGDGMQAHHG